MKEWAHEGKEDVPQGPVTVAIENLEGKLLRLRQGEITNDEFRPSRTILGVYGQRQPEEYMVRVRIPYGGLTSQQMLTLARIATDYGDGKAHVTTRQNIQLPWLKLDKVPEILWRLAQAGLTTLQAGGNSVRTVAACPLAGVCPKEAFDVTSYAKALDTYFLGREDVMHLPRKFKAAFSGCPTDCAYSAIQDFGAVAKVRSDNGAVHRGFQVVVGGSLGVYPRLAQPLEEFVAEEDLLPTCEAVVRVFDRLGDRSNKQKARLKFVLQRLGIEEFRRLVRLERESLRAQASRYPPPSHLTNGSAPHQAMEQAITEPPGAFDYQRWLRWNVLPEGRDGYYTVLIPLPLGDVTARQMEAVADLVDRISGATFRSSQQQDLVLRGVFQRDLREVFEALRAFEMADTRASGIADVVSCPGTYACSLGITASKAVARQLAQMMQAYQDDEALGSLRIKVSGCPDACGQHYLADIGLHGCAVHSGGRLYPAYQLLLGGHVAEGITQLAQPVVKLPARKVPQAVEQVLEHYRSNRLHEETFFAFVQRVGLEVFRERLAELAQVPPPSKDIWNFIDWDSTRMYILERGEGECAV
ncbi:MAG: nitrite/sulfite reductase [Chloroflexi bacterium]|nr:nitrite/sulfite reductase [Chloroflexota bacterium]